MYIYEIIEKKLNYIFNLDLDLFSISKTNNNKNIILNIHPC